MRLRLVLGFALCPLAHSAPSSPQSAAQIQLGRTTLVGRRIDPLNQEFFGSEFLFLFFPSYFPPPPTLANVPSPHPLSSIASIITENFTEKTVLRMSEFRGEANIIAYFFSCAIYPLFFLFHFFWVRCKDIPFAEAPVGELRLAPPVGKFELVEEESRDAREFGASCPQSVSLFITFLFPHSFLVCVCICSHT